MRAAYYAVRWGDTIRISAKVASPQDACRDCYGMVAKRTGDDANGMKFAVLGTTKAQVRKAMAVGLEKLPYQDIS